MSREEVRNLAVLVFEEYYKAITLNSDYCYVPTKIDDKALENFLDHIEKKVGINSVGFNWILTFIELSFQWWYKKTHLKFGTKSIKLSWIIGREAITRFDNLKGRKYIIKFYSKEIRKTVGTNIKTRLSRIALTKTKANNDWLLLAKHSDEEDQKKEFYNQPEGILWCRANTTLFNHNSELCVKCNVRLMCKELLKKEIPNLYNARGYNG